MKRIRIGFNHQLLSITNTQEPRTSETPPTQLRFPKLVSKHISSSSSNINNTEACRKKTRTWC